MFKQSLSALALALASSLAAAALAAPAKPAAAIPPAEYESRIQRAMADTKSLATAALAGKRAAFLCVYCHGEDGNSVQENIPNLAGQNPVYLLTQIQKFGDGRRNDAFMSGLIKSLKNEDRINMAVYYATMTPHSEQTSDKNRVELGRKRYLANCIGCHGPQAAGNKSIARLAGQRVTYLSLALNNYRTGKISRLDPVMTQVVRKLAPDDIPALAAYLSTLK